MNGVFVEKMRINGDVQRGFATKKKVKFKKYILRVKPLYIIIYSIALHRCVERYP